MRSQLCFLAGLTLLARAASPEYFTPAHQVSGIGIARDDISDELLRMRTDLMIQSQTFTIMREPLALTGAKRITADSRLQRIFRSAAETSGFPQSLLESIAFLESWGDANAESPAGPKGIMQISEATAHTMGLKVSRVTRYRTVKERVAVKSKGKKPKYRTVKRRVPYTVTVRDERMMPERAITAAANYLAAMEQKFGGRDWAIFAYHCGQGCVSQMLEYTRDARGISKSRITVPGMFFSCSPAWNRDLYHAVQQQMQRDYSPTYWFRIMRAEQLLALYRRDPSEYAATWKEFKSDFSSTRAPHRLAVWLKRSDLVFRNTDDLRSDLGRKLLVKAFDRPDYFGYSLNVVAGSRSELDYLAEASPAAVGALTYIAFETRRLHQALNPSGEKFRPLEVSSLIEPEDYARRLSKAEALSHCSGQVFDVDYSAMPPGELECLRFVLNDLGWNGYLGFVEEGTSNLHIGCSPESRDFFTTIFEEASGGKLPRSEPAQEDAAPR